MLPVGQPLAYEKASAGCGKLLWVSCVTRWGSPELLRAEMLFSFTVCVGGESP